MSKFFPSGTIRSLIYSACLLGACACVLPEAAFAVQWQWSQASGRERVTIILDNPVQKTEVVRSGTQGINVTLDPPAAALTSQGTPGAQALVSGATLENGQLVLNTSSPAFGFIATRPAGDRIVLDVFSDPLGARWLPEGGLAPASAVAAAQPDSLNAAETLPPSPAPTPQNPSEPAVAPTDNSPRDAAPASPIPPVTDTATPPAEVPSAAVAATAPASDQTVQSTSTPSASDMQQSGVASDVQLPMSVPENGQTVQSTSPAPDTITAPPPAPTFTPSNVVVNSGADNPGQPPTVRSRVNTGGPEAWPAEKLLSSDPSLLPPGINPIPSLSTPDATIIVNQNQPEPIAEPSDSSTTMTVTESAAEPEAAVDAEPEVQTAPPFVEAGVVQSTPGSEPAPLDEPAQPEKPESATPALAPIYKDEQGNIIPPPPDIPTLLKDMQNNMRSGKYADALPLIETLKDLTLSPEEREEVLYNEMTALFEVNHADLQSNSEIIIRAANAAMNFDQHSMRVPEAMSVLASVNLALNNLEDAIGYINLMHRQFPGNPNVPTALLSLGEKQMDRQEYAEATISFQTILQDYPESKAAKDAARLQTYALYRQGHMERALTLLDFVDRRWPRIYLEDPNFLSMAADIQFQQGKLEEAIQTFWTQYNLNPTDPSVAVTLQRLGELYYMLGDTVAASKVLEELVRAFPQSAEAPLALMRLGEGGLFEGNLSVDDMFAIFAAPNPRLPSIYYQRVLQEYPNSPQVMPAQLRTIAWQLWNKEYMPAMDAARSFMIDYADKPESLRAQDILMRGFAQELANALAEENFERVLMLWGRYPQVHEYYQPLEPDLRMAMARAYLNRGDEAQGLELMAPFLDGPGDTNYGLYTYNMFLNAYVRDSNWDGILTLGEKVATWNLPADSRIQLDYAMALAAENLGLNSRALPLWQKLAPREDIPLYQRAYATYFLARDAERRQDLRNAYQYNLDALGMFTQLGDDQSPYADSERVRESIAALMDVTEIAGRYAESLEWASKYATFVPTDSPDYAGLRFREARLHRKMGDMARWRSILQTIVDTEPDSVFGKMSASELHTQDVARDLTRFTQ